jgi:hypothetical protein
MDFIKMSFGLKLKGVRKIYKGSNSDGEVIGSVRGLVGIKGNWSNASKDGMMLLLASERGWIEYKQGDKILSVQEGNWCEKCGDGICGECA